MSYSKHKLYHFSFIFQLTCHITFQIKRVGFNIRFFFLRASSFTLTLLRTQCTRIYWTFDFFLLFYLIVLYFTCPAVIEIILLSHSLYNPLNNFVCACFPFLIRYTRFIENRRKKNQMDRHSSKQKNKI